MMNLSEQRVKDTGPNSIRTILDEYYEASKLNFDMSEDEHSYDSKEASKAADLILSQLEEQDQDCNFKQNVSNAKSSLECDYSSKSECKTEIEKTGAVQSSSNDIKISKASSLDHDTTASASEIEIKDKDINSNWQSKPKMSFLRKGSRQEPSALHRFRQGKCGSISSIGSSRDEKNNKEKETLQELEKMQEQQRENLQKRIEKRRQAREEIRKRSSGSGREVTLDTKVKPLKESTDEVCNMDSCENDDDSVTAISDADSTTDGDLTESSDSDDILITKATNSSYKMSQHSPEIHKGMKMAESNRQNDLQKRKGLAGRSPVPSIVKGNKVINKQSKKFQRNTEPSKNDIDPKEMEEQWQVIKCMRKRQESALRDAEREREEVSSYIYSFLKASVGSADAMH
jgi:hypothetical protein